MRNALCALILTVLAAAPSPASEPGPAGDLARLQGCWSAKAGPQHNIDVKLQIEGCRARVRVTTPQGLKWDARGEIKLDERAEPRALDWVNFNGDDDQQFPEILAIYRIEGDTFQVCNGGPNNSRPTAFKPGDGVLADLVVFSRTR